jgi:O-acetyl-ADP-ribose deacetylase (regulator of RNase III)
MPIISEDKCDLFANPAQTIVLPVNLVGAMGAGIAYPFKQRFPSVFMAYRELCLRKTLGLGRLVSYPLPYKDYRVLFFPTKDHWNDDSDIEYVEAGLEDLVARYKELEITELATPLLGTGCGKLEVDDVLPLMREHLNKLDIPVKICFRHY